MRCIGARSKGQKVPLLWLLFPVDITGQVRALILISGLSDPLHRCLLTCPLTMRTSFSYSSSSSPPSAFSKHLVSFEANVCLIIYTAQNGQNLPEIAQLNRYIHTDPTEGPSEWATAAAAESMPSTRCSRTFSINTSKYHFVPFTEAFYLGGRQCR